MLDDDDAAVRSRSRSEGLADLEATRPSELARRKASLADWSPDEIVQLTELPRRLRERW